MNAENILDLIHRAPFRPLELELDNGRKINVKHPDFILFAESKRVAIVTEGDHFHLIDLEHVSTVHSAL